MRDDSQRMRDMLDAIGRIEKYTSLGREEFDRNDWMQVWVVHHLQIIGEAARVLPDDVRRLAPEIEWPKIVGMRNVLVHGYFDIDTEIVWDAASRDAPMLKPRIERLLQRLEGQR